MFRDLHGWRFGRIAIALSVIVVGWYLLVVLVDWLFDSPQVFDVVVGGMWVLLFFAWVPAEVVLLTLWAGKGSRRRATLATAAERPGARPVAPAVPAEGDASPLVRSPAVASDIPVGADGRRPGAGYGIAAAALVLAAIALPYLMDMVGSLRGTQDPSVPEVFGLLLALLFLPLAATVLVLILLWAQKRNADHRPRRDDLFRDARGVRFGVIAYLCALVFFALPYVFLIVTELQRGVIAPDLIPSVDVFVQVWNVVFFIWLAIEVVLVLAWLVKRSKHRPPQAGLSPAHSERCRHCLGEGCWYCNGSGRVTNGSAPVPAQPQQHARPPQPTPQASPPYVPPPQAPDVIELEPPAQTNGAALAAMVVGILAAVGFWLPLVGPAVASTAVILGVVGLIKARQPGAPGRSVAIAGIVLGAISLVAGISVAVVAFRMLDTLDTNATGSSPQVTVASLGPVCANEGTPGPVVMRARAECPSSVTESG